MIEPNSRVQEFLQKACSRIRFKGVHQRVSRELSNHIEDQKIQYITRGLEEEAALSKALEQMGDPEEVGRQLDRTYRPRPEWSILILAVVLVLMGGAVQFFLSRADAITAGAFKGFLVYAPIGVAAFAGVYFFDYTLLGRYPKQAYLLLIAAAVLLFFLTGPVRGTYTHVYYAALLFIPAFAGVMYSFRGRGYWGIAASGLFFAGAAFICLAAPTVSGLLLFGLISLTVLTVAIEKGFFGANRVISLLLVYVPVALTGMLMLLMNPGIGRRLGAMINPTMDPRGDGWQQLMVRKLFASSHLFGQATPDSSIAGMPIERLLPGWSTDFALTYITTRLGYAAGAAIVSVMLVLIVRMFRTVMKQRNAYGFLVSLSTCLALTGQIIFYVIANTGFVMTFNRVLPFISYGGMGFVVNMVLLGLLLSVHRRKDLVTEEAGNGMKRKFPGAPLFTWNEGRLIIDFGTGGPESYKGSRNRGNDGKGE